MATAETYPTYYDRPAGAPDEITDPPSRIAGEGRLRQLIVSPYNYQRELIEDNLPARFNFLAWGTKAGKTTSAILRSARLLWGTKDQRFRWIAPFHGQSEMAKQRLLRILPKGSPSQPYYTYSAKANTITGPMGSQLAFYSGERTDTLPGDDVDGAILDEASRLREEVFNITVSTVMATGGWIMAISTPHGRNWFYQQCKKAWGGEPDYYFKRFTSVANPNMNRKILDQTRRAVPEFIYREMVMAEFVTQTATTFPDIYPCSTPTLPRNRPTPGHFYIIAVDVGQIRDRNVITIWDVFDASLVSWAVAQGRDYTLIEDDIEYLSRAWNHATVFVERNGPGLPIVQRLKKRGVPLGKGPGGEDGFTTTGGNKPALVHQWGLALRNREPLLPSREKWPDLYTEHENFEYTINKSGHWTFEAATGFHDDIVMSCLIGWYAVTSNQATPEWKRLTGVRKVGRRDKIIVNIDSAELDAYYERAWQATLLGGRVASIGPQGKAGKGVPTTAGTPLFVSPPEMPAVHPW